MCILLQGISKNTERSFRVTIHNVSGSLSACQVNTAVGRALENDLIPHCLAHFWLFLLIFFSVYCDLLEKNHSETFQLR